VAIAHFRSRNQYGGLVKTLRVVTCVFLLWGSVRLSSGQTPAGRDETSDVAALLRQHHAVVTGPALTLDEIERAALIGNPEIAVAARQLAAIEAHVPQAGALDDPALMYRGWQSASVLCERA